MSATAYPLSWPDALPRTTIRAASQFKTALNAAIANVRASLEAFGRDTGKRIADVVISSNVSLGVGDPTDPGVAVWFTWDGASRCIAVDRYPKVQDNLQAIHHILEARRTEMRHGGLHIVRQTFKGFVALPAPAAGDRWWELLSVSPEATPEQIRTAHREMIAGAHPDRGGSEAAAARINAARDAGLADRR